MERSFAAEVKPLTLGEGQIPRVEGIRAVTKALLQVSLAVSTDRESDQGYAHRPDGKRRACANAREAGNAIDALLAPTIGE